MAPSTGESSAMQKPGGRGCKSPQRLAGGGIRRHEIREIRREHEGRDQGEIGLRRPIEEDPAITAARRG